MRSAAPPAASRELPRVSVVVPCLNQGTFLRAALASIVAQNYPDVEIIVADGGSTDESVAVIESFAAKIACWRSGPDGGQSAAINWGVAQSSGEIVCWLNSDDLFCDGALLHVGRAARAFPQAGLFIGNGLRLNDDTGTTQSYCPYPLAFKRECLRLGAPYVHQPSAFFTRAAWDEAGGLDPDLKYCMDWDVLLRVSARQRVVLIDELLAVTREYADTKTAGGGLERALEIAKVAKRHAGDPLSAGSMAMLLQTLMSEADAEAVGFATLARLHAARRAVGRQLEELSCGRGAFPLENDPDVLVYATGGLSARSAVWRLPRPLQRLRWTLYDLALSVVGFGLRFAVAARLCSDARAFAILQSFRPRRALASALRGGVGGLRHENARYGARKGAAPRGARAQSGEVEAGSDCAPNNESRV